MALVFRYDVDDKYCNFDINDNNLEVKINMFSGSLAHFAALGI